MSWMFMHAIDLVAIIRVLRGPLRCAVVHFTVSSYFFKIIGIDSNARLTPSEIMPRTLAAGTHISSLTLQPLIILVIG